MCAVDPAHNRRPGTSQKMQNLQPFGVPSVFYS